MSETSSSGLWSGATLILVLLLGLGACGFDEHYTGLGDRAQPGDPLWSDPNHQEVAEGGDWLGGDTGTLEAQALAGKAFRLTNLRLSAPLDGKLGDGVNKYFTDGMSDGSLNVVLSVASFDGSALALRMGSAEALEDGSYQFNGPTADLACAMNGRGFVTQTGDRLEFPNTMLKPAVLPLENLALSGLFSEDGESLAQGLMEGALTMDEAATTKIMGVSLKLLLESMKRPADLDLDGDGTKDAWQFSGVFEANLVEEGTAP